MKKLTTKLTNLRFIVIFVVLLGSCKPDFLDEKIDNRPLINSIFEMESLLVNLHPSAEYLFTDYMTDDYDYHYQGSGQSIIKFLDLMPIYNLSITKKRFSSRDYSRNQVNPNYLWQKSYHRIVNCSMILEKVKKLKPQSIADQKRIKCIIGRSLAIRAYSYFNLINLFAKQYNPTTAYSDVGIPFIDKYRGKGITKFKTKSVGEVYDSIEADLLKASQLIDDGYIEFPSVNFNRLSTLALLCRFYLFKNKPKESIKYANLVLNERSEILDIKEIIKRGGGKPSPAGYATDYNAANNAFMLVRSRETVTFLGSADTGYYPYPLIEFFKKMQIDYSNHIFSPNLIYRHFHAVRKCALGNNHQTGLFVVDEVYFNKAESSILIGDFQTARKIMLQLIEKESYESTGLNDMRKIINDAFRKNQSEMIQMLLTAKRTRFFGEGMRWFDIKRHQLPVKHKLYPKGSGFVEIKGGTPEEYVIKPPLEEIEYGGG